MTCVSWLGLDGRRMFLFKHEKVVGDRHKAGHDG
jgi:hypothetical protein